MRQHFEGLEALVLVGGRAFVAYPYRAVEPVPDGVAVLHVADNPEAFGREHAADMALLGDIGATLSSRGRKARDARRPSARSSGFSPNAAARKRGATEALRREILTEPGEPLSPDAAVLAALDAMPKGALIANNSAATFGPVQELMVTEPGRYFFARGGVLGCSMPAAVGAALARARLGRLLRRRRRGDVFAAGAMERRPLPGARHLRGVQQSPLRRLAECREGPRLRQCGRRPLRRHGDRRSGDRFPGARRLDGRAAARAPTREAIAAAFAQAVRRDGPSLIEIAVR